MSLGHIYLIDDDESVRVALFKAFVQLGYSVDCFADAQSFIEQSPTRSPAVILLDMRLPEGTGVDIQALLKRLKLETPVVFMSGAATQLEIINAMRQGAFDFLLKPLVIEQLLTVVNQALVKDAAQQDLIARRSRLGKAFKGLTPREKQICKDMLDGKTNKQIAEQSGTVASTIKLHRARVLDKMGAESLADLISIFKGIEPDDLS
jgi:FixJ family two-component response regulator